MQSALDTFRLNMSRVRDLGAMYSTLKAQTTQVIDFSDILRAELVLAVSAFDHYIHEIVRIGMIESYRGNRPYTPAFMRFSVTLEKVLLGIANPQKVDWLESEIRSSHSWQSFQQADKVADAVRLVSSVKLWEEVAQHLGAQARDVKLQMNLIVDRRNKIAHEADTYSRYRDGRWPIDEETVDDADMYSISPGGRWPIDEETVDDSVDFLEQVAEAIFTIINS